LESLCFINNPLMDFPTTFPINLMYLNYVPYTT